MISVNDETILPALFRNLLNLLIALRCLGLQEIIIAPRKTGYGDISVFIRNIGPVAVSLINIESLIGTEPGEDLLTRGRGFLCIQFELCPLQRSQIFRFLCISVHNRILIQGNLSLFRCVCNHTVSDRLHLILSVLIQRICQRLNRVILTRDLE